MPIDRIPEKLLERMRLSDFAWDLTPEPTGMIGPGRTAILNYATWAQKASPYEHRHEGEIRVDREELTYILNILRAAHFGVMNLGNEARTPFLKNALTKFDMRPRPDPEQTAHLGTSRYYFPTAAHAINEFGNGNGFLLQPGQLIEEPRQVGWYASKPDKNRRVLKLGNFYQGDREVTGVLLVSE